VDRLFIGLGNVYTLLTVYIGCKFLSANFNDELVNLYQKIYQQNLIGQHHLEEQNVDLLLND
jgi:site-specific DNA-adenine methylase